MGEGEGEAVPPGFEPLATTSPFHELVGPIYEKTADGGFRRGFRVLRKHTNMLDIAHGGMMMTFADMLLARAMSLGLGRDGVGRRGVTMRLVAEFLAPPRPGDWVEGTAQVVRAGGSLAFVEGEAWVGERRVLAASATFRLRRQDDRRDAAKGDAPR